MQVPKLGRYCTVCPSSLPSRDKNFVIHTTTPAILHHVASSHHNTHRRAHNSSTITDSSSSRIKPIRRRMRLAAERTQLLRIEADQRTCLPYTSHKARPCEKNYTQEMSSSSSWSTANFSRSMSDSPRKRGSKSKTMVSSKKKVKMQGQCGEPQSLQSILLTSTKVIWPKDILPVEIFEMVVGYVSRENVQNMRLVNHEFEQKVSPYLFKRVVVPFKPELYSISKSCPFPQPGPQAGVNGVDTSHGAVLLQDKGMRVFQGFGSHIRQFAMSFEIDEAILSRPPIKSDQEAVTTFWGIYRWPHKEYNRYRQLEGLEQTADETRTMANALRYIKKAKELGLSIDGGLGWLPGPDSVEKHSSKPMVFGGPRCMPDEEPKKTSNSLVTPNLSFSDDYDISPSRPHREVVAERLLRESGYEGNHLSRSLRTLAESEGPAPAHPFQDDFGLDARQLPSLNNTLPATGFLGTTLTTLRTIFNRSGRDHASQAVLPHLGDLDRSTVLDYDFRSPAVASRSATSSSSAQYWSETGGIPLKPNDLTNAQKEMLLEIEWAQRAFMQSWAIAVIDNKDTFAGVQTLTIARLPGRHLPIIKRDDFWSSLSSLEKVSLAIIPDWREVTKLPTSFVQDTKLDPSRAVTYVYEILRDHIAKRQNVKSLHFEWICGGEEAVGQYARNRNILAAPFVPKALDMVNTTIHPSILSLPHIQHLSLKNCWFSPHVLLRFANDHRHTLLSLTLDSVSLCAPPTHNTLPGPLHNPAQNAAAIANIQALHAQAVLGLLGNPNGLPPINAAAAVLAQNGLPALANVVGPAPNFMNLANPAMNNQVQAVQAPVANAPPPPPPSASVLATAWREDPRLGSWPHIIDRLTPNETIAIQRFNPDLDFDFPPAPRPTSLMKMEFHSCGYVYLPLDYNQTILQPGNAAAQPGVGGAADQHGNPRRRSDNDHYMLKTSDAALGVIINYMDEIEQLQLEHAFRMHMGWIGDGASQKLADAMADLIAQPGAGRFSGVIEAY